MRLVDEQNRQDQLDRVIEQRLRQEDFLRRHPEHAAPITTEQPQGDSQCDEPCSSTE